MLDATSLADFSSMDETNEAWLFWFWGQSRILITGGQGAVSHHYAYWMPCPPLEAKNGPKVRTISCTSFHLANGVSGIVAGTRTWGKVSSSLSLRLSIMANHYCVQTILLVNTPSPGSPPYITTQNSLQGGHQCSRVQWQSIISTSSHLPDNY